MSLSFAIAPDPAFTGFPSVDTFTLAGNKLPGKWTLTDATKKYGWQIQQGYGLSGAVVFPIGDELVVAKFTGAFWASSDYAAFRKIRKYLLIKPVVKAGQLVLPVDPTAISVNPAPPASAALGIDHPELKDLGVTAVVVGEIGPGLQEEGGLWTVELSLLQYRPPAKVLPIPKQIIPDKPAQAPVAQSAQEVELQGLQATLAKLQGAT